MFAAALLREKREIEGGRVAGLEQADQDAFREFRRLCGIRSEIRIEKPVSLRIGGFPKDQAELGADFPEGGLQLLLAICEHWLSGQ